MPWLWFFGTIEIVFMAGVLGQAAVAALAGMRVEVISFGYGPRLVRAGRVQLALFPLGGHVRVAGLHPTETTVDDGDRRAFFNRPWPLRALVVVGWPIGGLLFVMAGTAGTTLAFGVASVIPEVATINRGSPAESAGLRPGDQILAIDGVPPTNQRGVAPLFEATRGRPFILEVGRGDERLQLRLAASELEPGVYRIGIQLTARVIRTPASLPEALSEGVRTPYSRLRTIVAGLFEIFAGREKAEFRGPVGIAATFDILDGPDDADLALVLATYLVVWSLLPVPPLPGGQLLLVLLGWRSRRHRSAQAARDLGEAVRTRHRMPPALLVALVSVVLLAAGGVSAVVDAGLEGGFLLAGIAAESLTLLLAAALALRLPRAWAWGVYLPLLHLPSVLMQAVSMSSWMSVAGLALLLAIPASLVLPPVRRAFGRECPACQRLAAAPVRSSPRTSCLACGSSYSLLARSKW